MSLHRYTLRGNVTIESILYFSVVLVITLSGFHLAALMHASHVGSVAASRGASLMARSMASNGNELWAMDEIRRVTEEMGGKTLQAPHITESPTHCDGLAGVTTNCSISSEHSAPDSNKCKRVLH
jgi:hypothetical protein